MKKTNLSSKSQKPVIILGGGGHAGVLVEILLNQEVSIIGLTDPNRKAGERFKGIAVLGDDSVISTYSPHEVDLVLGIGSIKTPILREKLYLSFKQLNYFFRSVIHETAIISNSIQLGEGVQILAGAIVSSGVKLGQNVILNNRSLIEHDCMIGDHVHISSGAVVCGDVVIESVVHVGACACILQGIRVGANCCIGASTLVTRDVGSDLTVIGIPARILKT